MAVIYDFQNPRPLPDTYPAPAKPLTGIDVAFSTASGHLHKGGAYLSYHEGQCKLVDRKWKDIASSLFFKGGRIEDFGFRLREDAPAQARVVVRQLMASWDPKHEEKEATVGFVISKWWEPEDGSQHLSTVGEGGVGEAKAMPTEPNPNPQTRERR